MLSKLEINVLKKGSKYGIKPKKVNTYEISTNFEELSQTLKISIYKDSNQSKHIQIDENEFFFHELKSFVYEFLDLSKRSEKTLSKY